MSFFLRLFGFVVFLPSLVHAAALGVPGDGTNLSGVGVISGWKCEANGEITVEFLNAAGERVVINEGRTSNPVPVLHGSERPDVLKEGACASADVGFVAIWNWGELGDGTYTAVASDNDGEFARNTFTVTTPGDNFLEGVSKEVTVEDFPHPGDTTVLEWNQGTQHFEIVDFMEMGPTDLGMCTVGMTVRTGESCTGTILAFSYTFTVNADGQGCISGTGLDAVDGCYATPDVLPDSVMDLGVDLTRNTDGSWTIDSLPPSS